MTLQRKKVTVRTKRGKVYQRSMMVQAQAIGRRASKSGKLHALNPWEQRHTEHVSTNSGLNERAKAYGSSGPGSDHSWIALAAGHNKQRERTMGERFWGLGYEHLSHGAAEERRSSGERAFATAMGSAYLRGLNPSRPSTALTHTFIAGRTPAAQRISELSSAFGVPASHVRRNYKGARFPSNW